MGYNGVAITFCHDNIDTSNRGIVHFISPQPKRRAFTGQGHKDGLLATIAFHEQSVGGIHRQRDDAQCSILASHTDDGGQQELEWFTALVPLKRTF